MKTFFAAAALACISIASVPPASAQTGDRSYWTGYKAGQSFYADEPWARGARPPIMRSPSTNPAYDVYDPHGYIGADPDSFIHGQLGRDPRGE